MKEQKHKGPQVDSDIKSSVNNNNTEVKNKSDYSENKELNNNTKDILRKRAKLIALKNDVADTDVTEVSVLKFVLGAEEYAFETKYVREIVTLTNYTEIPGLPAFIHGVLNIRGQIVSIVNLKKLMNLPEKGLGEFNKIIMLENENMEFGVLADVIDGTSKIPSDSIQKKVIKLSDEGNKFLLGVTKDHLMIFDANKILNYEKLIINQI